ncbi:MAG: DoxX family membrane protein, partial [Pseudomonadota bacterium]|nr:DoxX family membrane protein [Pseudomonadota bacterium]
MIHFSSESLLRFWPMRIIAGLMGRIGDLLRIDNQILAPLFDLLVRLWLASIFLKSGFLKVSHWDTAVMLATHEYPVSWMEPVTAAYAGAGIELVCAALLALGLATRLAALPLLILSLVIQFEYKALNENLYWALLFGWYVIMGPGRISLDRLLSHGLRDSAIPFAGEFHRFFGVTTLIVGRIYRLLVRTVLAGILLTSGLAAAPFTDALVHYHFPVPLLPPEALYTPPVVYGVPLLLLPGLATRLTALAAAGLLAVLVIADPPAAPLHTDYIYITMLLGFLAVLGPGRLSLDYLIDRWSNRVFPQYGGRPAEAMADLPHVVI